MLPSIPYDRTGCLTTPAAVGKWLTSIFFLPQVLRNMFACVLPMKKSSRAPPVGLDAVSAPDGVVGHRGERCVHSFDRFGSARAGLHNILTRPRRASVSPAGYCQVTVTLLSGAPPRGSWAIDQHLGGTGERCAHSFDPTCGPGAAVLIPALAADRVHASPACCFVRSR